MPLQNLAPDRQTSWYSGEIVELTNPLPPNIYEMPYIFPQETTDFGGEIMSPIDTPWLSWMSSMESGVDP